MKLSRMILKPICHFIAIVLFRLKKVGEENVPKEGGYILCGNHIHALDGPAVVASMKRKVRFMVKKELFKNKFLKWFMQDVFEAFPVDRGKRDIESIKTSLKIIKDGDILGIFPEGTRNGLKKNTGIKNGAAYLALRTGAKVIPVGIQGNFKPFTKVTLNFGKPLDFSEYCSKTPEKEDLEKVSEIIMNNIIQLTNEKV